MLRFASSFFFFFNNTATPEIYTLSLHDALPIYLPIVRYVTPAEFAFLKEEGGRIGLDRKSTRLNSCHLGISYAVFCLKKKKKNRGVLRYRLHVLVCH